MTIHECHIDFLSKLQEQSSFQYQHLQAEEIDWILYQHQYRFIREVMDPKNNKHEGFEWTQRRYDEIESLITEKSLTAFVKDENNVMAYLPADYYRLINDSSLVGASCQPTGSNSEASELNYSVIPFVYQAYTRYQITVNLDAGGDITYDSLLHFSSGVSADLSQALVKDVLDFYNLAEGNGGVKAAVYWETFGELYHPNSFIVTFVTDEGNVLDLVSTNITIDDVGAISSYEILPYQVNTKVTTTSTKLVDNRLVTSQIIRRANKNPFMRTRIDSPLSTIERGRIIVNHQSLFDIYGLVISYIRTPRMVSLSLGLGFEVGTGGNKDDIHRRIVDMAVETTALQIRAGNVQLIQMANAKSD